LVKPNHGSSFFTGASQFLTELFFSLAPGFSRVNRARGKWKRFQPFSAPAATKPLKRLGAASPAPTGLKPGANERLQESVRCASFSPDNPNGITIGAGLLIVINPDAQRLIVFSGGPLRDGDGSASGLF
jgi:hypothetical protein